MSPSSNFISSRKWNKRLLLWILVACRKIRNQSEEQIALCDVSEWKIITEQLHWCGHYAIVERAATNKVKHKDTQTHTVRLIHHTLICRSGSHFMKRAASIWTCLLINTLCSCSHQPLKCWECVIRNYHLCWSRDQSWGHSQMNPWILRDDQQTADCVVSHRFSPHRCQSHPVTVTLWETLDWQLYQLSM